ncbi:MAG: GWxTD domain-containing protein [bacterium]|nr:GWxTD domain-containing protein [bacterium]
MLKKYLTITLYIILIGFVGLPPALHGQGKKSKLEIKKGKKVSRKKHIRNLAPKYREWLTTVHYIITKTEKQVFFRLTNNRDRDSFISLFWNLRDPSKGTPINEYKTEHLKRVKYANRYFKYGSPLPGWKTDRGRIHILLGPPMSKNEVIQNGLYPVEIWEYMGGGGRGLPTAFRMVFYKSYNSGDYKQYIPAVDGPASLLRTNIGEVDPADYYSIYQKIKEIEPAVAQVSLSLIHGETGFNYSPSLRGPILISQIMELPKRKINANYARNFLNYKGIVETSVTTNYIDVKTDIYVMKDPFLNMNFVHMAILPSQLSVDYSPEQDKYYFNFNLMIILSKDDKTVMQYNKDFPFYYTKEELDAKISHGIILTDYFPVIEGKFKLSVVLKNSINKEISYFEKYFTTPSINTGLPRIFGPMVTYGLSINDQSVTSPFSIAGYNLKMSPKRIFGLKDTISSFFCVEKGSYNKPFSIQMDVECMDERRPYSKQYSFDYSEGKKFQAFTKELEKLNYGSYVLKTKILDTKGIIIDVKEKEFQVSPLSIVPHPPLASKRLRNENTFIFHMNLATQYMRVKNEAKAELFFQKALKQNKSFAPLIKNYAFFLLSRKKYDQVLTAIESLKGNQKEMFHYFAYKGKALYFKKQYNAAIEALLEANKIYDSDITILNSLGLSLIKTGDKTEAARALSASLKINEHQKDITDVHQKLQKELENEKPK